MDLTFSCFETSKQKGWPLGKLPAAKLCEKHLHDTIIVQARAWDPGNHKFQLQGEKCLLHFKLILSVTGIYLDHHFLKIKLIIELSSQQCSSNMQPTDALSSPTQRIQLLRTEGFRAISFDKAITWHFPINYLYFISKCTSCFFPVKLAVYTCTQMDIDIHAHNTSI